MLKKDFWYDLPKELIAQEPASPRDAARLMVLHRDSDAIEHRIFHDLPEYLMPGDLLVVNNSKVLPARIVGVKQPTGAVCELLLLRQVKGDQWECLAKPGKRMHPGNVVTFWATADAFGVDGLVLWSGCADPCGPKTVRSTMGAAFRLPVWECTLEQAAARLRAADIPLYATALQEDTVDVRQVSLTRSGVIIGSEGRGVSDLSLQLCEKTVKIPMVERCDSLNAAVAASVVLWEMAREQL